MGAPNVYDTSYVNSGPGVGLSNSGSSYGSSGYSSSYGNETDSKNIEAISDVPYVAKSFAHLAQTSPAGSFVRDAYENPNTSAYATSLFNDFMSNYGSGYDMDEYYDKILDLTNANNQWSAAQAGKAMRFEGEQAQKQMDFQTMSNKLAMQWSAEEALKSREWTERLSNTAHRREMQDLLKAGLNPILAANNGAYTGSGATGQAFSSSGSKGNGSMGQTDMSASSVMGNLMSGIMTTARDLAVTRMNLDQQKYNTDMQYAMSKLAAGASIYNNNNSISAQKAINQLNREADITKAGISADATRAAAATSAGAMMSAAKTNAAAAQYSADQHLKASQETAGATKFSAQKSYDSTKYQVDNNWKNNPRGYIINSVKELSDIFSDRNNTYTPDFDNWNNMGAE